LDRVIHHAETVVIEGKSYRKKDQIERPTDANTGPNPPSGFHAAASKPTAFFTK
jgi:hypothetical protein